MEGQVNRDRIAAELSNMLGDRTQGTTGGSFEFTESEIRQVITNWVDLVDSYDKSISNLNWVGFYESPGLDYASKAFASKTEASGKALVDHLGRGRDYCQQQAQLALDALSDYLGVENMTMAEFYKAQHPDQHTEV